MSDPLVHPDPFRPDPLLDDPLRSGPAGGEVADGELVRDGGGLLWRHSSRSTAMSNCVEAAKLPDESLAVRDSKDVTRRPLRFSPRSWSRFVTAVSAESVG
ncbi:DUF397 domain-containing protein [Streptomyces sp. NPDC004726]